MSASDANTFNEEMIELVRQRKFKELRDAFQSRAYFWVIKKPIDLVSELVIFVRYVDYSDIRPCEKRISPLSGKDQVEHFMKILKWRKMTGLEVDSGGSTIIHNLVFYNEMDGDVVLYNEIDADVIVYLIDTIGVDVLSRMRLICLH